ncbi:hypothetical protein JCM17961_31970 [Endothiovibrio diazotrophicus]
MRLAMQIGPIVIPVLGEVFSSLLQGVMASDDKDLIFWVGIAVGAVTGGVLSALGKGSEVK